MKTTTLQTIDDYIAAFPKDVQNILETVRSTVQKAAPKATEKISYGMPTFYLHGNLVHFAAFKNHIGFYATPTGHGKFQKELAKYKTGKGSVKFPIDKPIPYDLIRKIVVFRASENRKKSAAHKA
jgi:uncharacterized protein YdhG (YjbR/CyaY superfamily)